MSLLQKFAYHPGDDAEKRQEKVAALIISGSCSIAGCVWAFMYFMVFGFGLTALLPLMFVVIVGACILFSHIRKNPLPAVNATILCIIYITAFIQWTIGGVFDSGFVLAWAFVGPITALMFFSFRRSLVWLFLYLANIAITIVFNGYFSAHGQAVEEDTKVLFFVMNLSVSSLVVFVFAYFFVSNALREKEKANGLLLNILPRSIANRLKYEKGTIAEHYDDVTVLFTDFKGFTELSEKFTAEELVTEIDTCFKAFDQIVTRHNLEKIKTIGDSYMCAGGLPVSNTTHAVDAVSAALEIRQFMEQHMQQRKTEGRETFEIRIGVHTGPAVAGIVGVMKFQYDIWGDTVNTASRMESSGEPGKVNISGVTYERVKEKFSCTYRGKIPAKGKGEIDMYFAEG